jgi:hypothetical protein
MMKTSYYADYVQILSKAEKQELLRFHGEGQLCANLVQKQRVQREEREQTYRERYYAFYGQYPHVKQQQTKSQPTSNK